MSELKENKSNGILSKLGLKKENNNDLHGMGNRSNIRTNPNIPMRDRDSLVKLWDVINSGKKYSEVLEYIENEITESTRLINYDYKIDCFLSDGAYALSRAVEKKIGYARQSDKKNMSGDNPPKMLDIAFADGTHKKVPFGKIELPIFGEEAYLDMRYDYENSILYLEGQCEKRFVNDMDDIINSTKKILATDSIYKGKAIKYINGKEPEFINVANVDKSPLFLTKTAKFSTQPIEARIEKTELCVERNIDLKYGVILSGTFGTGKTLYAFKLAQKAINNGWMFLYVKEAKDTLEAMKVAQKYANNGKGIVLFVEDIDSVLSKRDNYTNEISLLLDGGETKNIPVITVFTTNHIERIDPTFLRGKRIGSIITLTAPDKDTANEILINTLTDINGKQLFKGSLDKSSLAIEVNKIVPAFISEIVESVKAHMTFSGKEYCDDDDILVAIESYKSQIEIAQLKSDLKTNAEQLSDALRNIVNDGIDDNFMKKDSALDQVYVQTDNILERV